MGLDQGGQTCFLLAVLIKIIRREPFLVSRFQPSPLAVDDAPPSRVSVAAMIDLVLPEGPFEAKTQPFSGDHGRGVGVVALPLVAPVTQIVEDVLHEQELRLGRHAAPGHLWGEANEADFDRAGFRADPQETELPCCHLLQPAAGIGGDDRVGDVVHRVRKALPRMDKRLTALERAHAGKKHPLAALAVFSDHLIEQVWGMPVQIERL